ncbi:mucosal pentraxin-like [Leucoraja erinacea]|uniref:mucosal pentraxin-like n=1 Tax=Leucoraja erinaceus TaxID=7782 RepID=UPI0024575A52|nr:mucosal pentraxin-like [Leucoraja erinacea]
MKPFIPVVLVMCIYLSGSVSAGLNGKSLIFDKKTNTDFVRFHAADFSSLTAFTVCLRAGSEIGKGYSLFTYATHNYKNELLLWQRSRSQICVYISNKAVMFTLADMTATLRRICVSWESKGGETTVWINGQRSIQEIAGKGRVVGGNGQFTLGQYQSSVGKPFNKRNSFVGEITDVNMWDRVLNANEIESFNDRCYRGGGNIINWGTTAFTKGGDFVIKDNHDCPH